MIRRLELLGEGLSHSLSPSLWQEIFAATGADFEYGLRDVSKEGLTAALADLRSGAVHLFNVTMPYKAWACGVAEIESSEVSHSRVANTLWMEGGRMASANTDVLAARLLLGELPERCDSALVLGAGSTGRSLATAARAHVAKVFVTNRFADRLAELARDIPGVIAVSWEDRQDVAAQADLVVNTTPSGLRDDDSPLRDLTPRGPARTRYFYDLIYSNSLTPLQRQAAAAGMRMVDGLAHLEAHAHAMIPMLGLSMSRETLRSKVRAAAGRAPRSWDPVSA